jgi:cation transport regulator ChaC
MSRMTSRVISRQIRARARALLAAPGPSTRDAPEALRTASVQIARELQLDVRSVEAEVAALFEKGSSRPTSAAASTQPSGGEPPRSAAAAAGSRAADLLANNVAMGSAGAWDPVARLPAPLRARLGPADLERIHDAIGALQQAVREHKLDWVPVFGYLSLRTHNFAELGKRSQDEVVHGRDVVNATLPGFDVEVVASSMLRGTPEHPGAVAGLGKKEGGAAPGVILKLPLARAEELLARLLARELFAEADLADGRDDDGRARSNQMYTTAVEVVQLETGESVPALVFMTNAEGEKAVSAPGAFGDGAALTVERAAWLIAGQGGFVDAEGRTFGGPSVEYWEKSYLLARQAAGQPVDPKIAAAIELSKLHPQEEVVDRLLARQDDEARLMVEALRFLFQGAAVPLGVKRAQKDAPGLVRTPVGQREDALPRLLAKAHELLREGKIKVE